MNNYGVLQCICKIGEILVNSGLAAPAYRQEGASTFLQLESEVQRNRLLFICST